MNNTLITVVINVTAASCHEASKAISSYWDQEWPHKELIVVNRSDFTFGNAGYTEIVVAEDVDESTLLNRVVEASSGEFIVEWRPDHRFAPNTIKQFSEVARHAIVVNGYAGSRHVATFFSRKTAKRRESIPNVRIDLTPADSGVRTLAAPELPEDNDRLNLLCAGGIGDVLWVLAKFGRVCAEYGAVIWLPESEQHRSGALARMCGVDYAYLPGLTTHWVWDQPSEPELVETGWLPIQANRHLEAGKHLRDWYPDLPLAYPKMALHYACRPKIGYVVVFMCVANYMGGQLQPHVWANILQYIERNVGPVMIIGAAKDVLFAAEVEKYYKPALPAMYDRPLEEVVAVMLDATFVCGVASGLLITSIVYGAPSLISYPTHLASMPGTWEPENAQWGWCFHKDLPGVVLNGGIQRILNNETVHRHLHL